MINIELDDLYTNHIAVDILRETAEYVLIHQNNPQDLELTIAIKDIHTLHNLNKQFMEIDSPTDVLTFTANELDPETNLVYLGDIIISYEIADKQAREAGHSTMAELQLLVVHGMLHLLDFDHATPEDKARMWSAQHEILTNLQCPLAKFPD